MVVGPTSSGGGTKVMKTDEEIWGWKENHEYTKGKTRYIRPECRSCAYLKRCMPIGSKVVHLPSSGEPYCYKKKVKT